jgi:hypothetical protein
MGFWNKLGKIALQVAPYVAAPFTGGASLAFAPAARNLGQKWAQHDAESAARKGLAPSRFDRYLDMGSGMAGMAGGAGAFGGGNFSASNFNGGGEGGGMFGLGGVGGTGNTGFAGGLGRSGGGGTGNWQSMLAQVLDRGTRGGGGDSGGYSRGGQGQGGYSYGRGNEQAVGRGDNGMSNFAMRMRHQLGPVMGQEDQSNPNLAMSLGAGRMDAMRNQPWRGGYDVQTQGPDDTTITDTMPPIYPNNQRRRNPYGNELGGGDY